MLCYVSGDSCFAMSLKYWTLLHDRKTDDCLDKRRRNQKILTDIAKHLSPVKQIKPEIPFNILTYYHFQNAGLKLMLPTEPLKQCPLTINSAVLNTSPPNKKQKVQYTKNYV